MIIVFFFYFFFNSNTFSTGKIIFGIWIINERPHSQYYNMRNTFFHVDCNIQYYVNILLYILDSVFFLMLFSNILLFYYVVYVLSRRRMFVRRFIMRNVKFSMLKKILIIIYFFRIFSAKIRISRNTFWIDCILYECYY